jgi:hypothetical protein
MRRGHVTAAMMTPIQNVQLQLTLLMKPEIGGPMMGPNVVAAIKYAMLLPLLCGSWYTSAQIPPTTLSAQLPPTPTSHRNTTSEAKFGETDDAIEKIVNMAKEVIIGHLRPKDSESGPHISGPQV